ncbi:hypothetical protein K2X14_02235 [Acetobacter sp. TBRC 12305]|uniref:Uncharacterized protein n=1 Tax=Acetobacter garciniae TaxID=2817435 RepID=A0A939HID3_9PROT|nr:hypothetical protein [Acetobacter garciniae]MBO1323972.1 hypothetical protein [Acetobacter garciniae]MBX0343661.1 hypothetical protein [Acetobacter garciniae]
MRFIYLDCSLKELSGHHYNFCKRIIGMAEEAGLPVTVLANNSLPADLADEMKVNIVPYFRFSAYSVLRETVRDSLRATETVRRRMLEELRGISGIGQDDIVYVNSVLPSQLLAVTEWVSEMGEKAPTIVAEVFYKTYIDFNESTYEENGRDFSDQVWLYVGDILPSPENMNFRLISFNSRVSNIYSRILHQPVFTLTDPLRVLAAPKNRAGKKKITIGLGGHQRHAKGYHHLEGIIHSFLRERDWDHVCFRIHNSRPDQAQDIQRSLHQLAAADNRIEILEGSCSGEEWNAFIDSLDIVLCPYEPGAYKGSWSGLACEGFSSGAPVVVPNSSASAEFLLNYNASFEGFDDWTVPSIFEALKKVVDHYDEYASRNYEAASAFYENEKGANIVKEIIEKFK